MKFWWSVVVGVTVVVSTLGAWYLERQGRERTQRYVELASTYTLAFADRAALYLSRGRPEDLNLLANTASTLLFGNVILYAQVVSDGASVVDVRAGAGRALELPRLATPPSLQSQLLALSDGTPYVDVVKSLFPLKKPDGQPLRGYVRVGTSLAQLRAELHSERLTVLGIGLGVWAALLGTFWLGRWPRRSQRLQPAAPPPAAEPATVRQVGPLALDDTRKAVTVRGEVVELSPKEFELLQLLCSHPGRVFSNQEILRQVWTEQSFASAQDVKQYIYFLRRKLEADPKRPEIILTVRGFGYKVREG